MKREHQFIFCYVIIATSVVLMLQSYLGFFEKGHIQTSLYSEFEQILNEGSQVRPLSEVVRGAPWRRQIALTFDGGSGADALPELLAALRGASVKCTFFLTGEWVQRYPNSAKQIVTEGHEIGNHTWSHPDLSTLSDRDISWEIERADAAIQAFYGQSTRPLFRAPFGARNNRVLRVVHALGYRSVYWSLDSLDSVGVAKSSSFIVAMVTSQPDKILDGAIVLLHVGNTSTARALPEILRVLKARHFEFVSVTRLIPSLRNIDRGASHHPSLSLALSHPLEVCTFIRF